MNSSLSRRRAGAFTLVEMLLAMAICAVIMTALAAATGASFSSIKANESAVRLATRGRNTVNRMVAQVRRGSSHAPYTKTGTAYNNFLAGAAAMDDVGFSVVDDLADGTNVTYTYWFDSANSRIMMTRTVATGTTTTPAVFLDGVNDFKVRLWPGRSAAATASGGNYDLVLLATVLMEIKNVDTMTKNSDTMVYSGSAVPRKCVWTGQKLTYTVDQLLSANH